MMNSTVYNWQILLDLDPQMKIWSVKLLSTELYTIFFY